MWTGTIVVISFCGGFFLASLLASAGVADAEMEVMRRTPSSHDDHRRKAVRGASGRSVMNAMGASHSPGRNSEDT